MYEKLLAKNLLCTGCGACVNKCANNAIDFVYDNGKDGSLIAKINEEKCTFCHACEEVCPVMTEHVNTNRKADDCFAVWADDIIRMQSSSGGAFTVLAEMYYVEVDIYVQWHMVMSLRQSMFLFLIRMSYTSLGEVNMSKAMWDLFIEK